LVCLDSDLTFIGYGDYHLESIHSKKILIWHILIGIASLTFLTSMIAEWIMDLWTLETERIENRVGRYETKARLKKIFQPKDQETEHLNSDSLINEPTTMASSAVNVDSIPVNHGLASTSLPSGFVHIQAPRQTSLVMNRRMLKPSRIFSYNNKVSFFDNSPNFKPLESTEDDMESGHSNEESTQ
jgi:hypothetical protein